MLKPSAKLLGTMALVGAICAGSWLAAQTQEPSWPREAEDPAAPKPAPASSYWRTVIGEYESKATATTPAKHLILFEKDGKGWVTVDRAEPRVIPRPSKDLWISVGDGPNERVVGFVTDEGSFDRLQVGPAGGGQLRIKPLRDVAEVTKESLESSPPVETGDFKPADLVELATLDETIKLDIRYATTNNFLGSVFYSQARAFAQRPAAEAALRAHKVLKSLGYGLLIHDGYRPWSVTRTFWVCTPSDKKWLVANPASGSKHNRGAAIDLTLYDLKTGAVIEMPSTYDESTSRAYAFYPGGTSLQRWHRALLRRVMEAEGFTVNPEEWWHFDYKDWKSYAIGNVPFDKIR